MNRIERLVGVQKQRSNRFTGVLAGLILLTVVVSIGASAQILIPSSTKDSVRINPKVAFISKQEPTDAGTLTSQTSRLAEHSYAGQDRDLAQDDRIAEALIPALQDRSWNVRKAAVETLARLNSTRATELLIAALKDGHRQVREHAVIGLGARGDTRLVEHLTAALIDDDWQVREQAAIALGRQGDSRGIEPLLKALMDSEWQVREQAARSLGATAAQQSVQPLLDALNDQHEQVREAAAKSLGLIGDAQENKRSAFWK